MRTTSRIVFIGSWVAVAVVLTAVPAQAVSIGFTDTFSNGTLLNWTTSLGPGGGVPPVPPTVVGTGGPNGAGDAFMRLTAIGLCDRPGCRLVAMNPAQWAGNYLAAGVNRIEMDLRNLGATDLTIRLLFEDPLFGPPADEAVTTFGAFLPAGGAWTHVGFNIAPGNLTALLGNSTTLMSNVTILRIIHSTSPSDPQSVVGTLGVDNIRAQAVPEPASLLLAATGLVGLAGRRLRRRPSPS